LFLVVENRQEEQMSQNVLVGFVLSGALALAGTAVAQTPATPQSPPQPTRPAPGVTVNQRSETASGPVTVEGCLKREADVPGRKPNAAESVGIGEDFVLTGSKMIKGSAPGDASRTETPVPGVTVTKGSNAEMMFDVKGLSADQLKSHLNERVEIVGVFEKLDRAGAAARDPNAELVELRGTSIRPVSGGCSTQ
jgi:hypothetical protein